LFIHPGFGAVTLQVTPEVVPTLASDLQVTLSAGINDLVINGIVPSVNVLDSNGKLVALLSGSSVVEDGSDPTKLLVTLPSSLVGTPINYLLQVTYTAGSGQTAVSGTTPFAVGPNRINVTATPTPFAGNTSATVILTGETLSGLAVPLNSTDYNSLQIVRLADGHTFTFGSTTTLSSPISVGTTTLPINTLPSGQSYTVGETVDIDEANDPVREGVTVTAVSANALTVSATQFAHSAGATVSEALVLVPQSDKTLLVTLNNNPAEPWNDVLSTAGALQFNLGNAADSGLVYPLSGNLVIQYLDPIAPSDGSPNASFLPSNSVSSQLNLLSIPGSYSTETAGGDGTDLPTTNVSFDSIFTGGETNTDLPLIGDTKTASQSILGYEIADNTGTLTGLTGLNTPTGSLVGLVAYWVPGADEYTTPYNLTTSVAVNDGAGTPSFPVPGLGYWSRLWTQTAPAIQSVVPNYDIHVINKGKSPADNNGFTEVHLKLGWNLIGDPYYYPVPLTSLQFSNISDQSAGWTTADLTTWNATVGQNWIASALYRYHASENANYIPVYTGNPQPFNTALEPFAGYWIYSGLSDLYLEVPDPGN
jgi:hypothetical protein